MPVENQVAIIFAFVNDFLSDIKVDDIRRFESEFLDYMETHHRDILKKIAEEKELTDEIKEGLQESIVDFKKIFLQEG